MLPGFCFHDFWWSPEPCWATPCILTQSRNRRYTPHAHTISRYSSVILMNKWKGSLLLGRYQIIYHHSYLNKGRTSVLASRPFPLSPTTCYQCQDYWAQSPTRYLMWCTRRATSSLIMLGVITNNNIYKWELFHHTHFIEKQNFTNSKYFTQSSVPLWQSGTVHFPLAKTGEISIATETICKQGLWLYSLLQMTTENSP